MRKSLWLAAGVSLGLSLVACADETDDQVVNDHEIPGVQEAGSTDTIPRGCATIEPTDEQQVQIEADLAYVSGIAQLT